MSINPIYLNLWAPTAGLLQGLTVLPQFAAVCSSDKV